MATKLSDICLTNADIARYMRQFDACVTIWQMTMCLRNELTPAQYQKVLKVTKDQAVGYNFIVNETTDTLEVCKP